MQDRNHFVVDEMSQLPPHLLPPPYLVNIDGNAHPLRYQEAILRLIRPVKQVKSDTTGEDLEDYDEYMKKHLAKVKQQGFGFSRAKISTNSNLQSQPQALGISNCPEESSNPLEGTTATALSNEAITQGNGAITQGNEAITQGSSASILNQQATVGAFSEPTTPLDSSIHQDANTSQNNSRLSSNHDSSVYLAAEHSYAGSQTKDASRNATGSGLQSRGSQFLSPVQSQRMVVAVVMDRGKEESGREAQAVESVSRTGMDSGNSSIVENVQCEVGGEAASSELSADIADETEPGSGEQQGTGEGDGRHFSIARRLRTRARGGSADSSSRPSGATANSSPPPPPPPPLAGADTNGGPTADNEEPIVNVTDNDVSSDNIRNMLSSLVYSLGLGEMEEKEAISLWHNRVIVPSLDVAILSSEEARRRELCQQEERCWEEENKRVSRTLTPVRIAKGYV